VAFPPLQEQERIAAYLDASCAAIDAAVAAKHRQVAALEALRLSTVTHAVTAGLDPSATRKGCHTPWFREAPSHWRIERLKDIVSAFVDYRGKTPQKTREGIPLITARNIRGGRIDFSESQEYISEDDYDDWMVRGFPQRGDVLVTTEAPMGEVAPIEDTRIALAQRIVLLKTRKSEMTNEYLRYYFLSAAGAAEIRRYATGSTALGIKARWLKIISVLVPPLAEQQAISHLLDDRCGQIEPLSRTIGGQIDALMAYRASLIHECATGQRRVSEEDLNRVKAHG
jgi:type I restriction enzyme S subunit